MSDQQSLNSLLQWSIENSATGNTQTGVTSAPARSSGLNAQALAELLGGPSDADRMRDALTAILDPSVSHENKLVAWDNMEQMIEQIDNANNLEPMGMWPPLLQQLEHGLPASPDDTEVAEMRRMAAWCVSTAVQNNVKAQERLLEHGGVEKLASLATGDRDAAVRKKAISALSSATRNFQPALDRLESVLPEVVWTKSARGLDAADMDAVDEVIGKLRAHSATM